MGNKQITDYSAKTELAATDQLIIQESGGTTKKTTVAELGIIGGWMPASETWTYASSTTFTISGDYTSKYSVGMKLKLTQTSIKYFTISAISYSSPNTTVTVYGGSTYTLANEAITSTYFSHGQYPIGMPALDYENEYCDLKFQKVFKAISPTWPWFCLSYADTTWTTANYSAEFIAYMRTLKVTYDEMSTNVSSFGGAWSGDTYTLTNNATNIAMITALAREYLYAGSPTTNWRILHDGTNEFNIIAISVSARTIKVNLDSKTATGTAIEIYRHRVYGSTTSARHFSEAGLGFYQGGGDKVSGLRRLDQFEKHHHSIATYKSGGGYILAIGTAANYQTLETIIGEAGDPTTDGTYTLRTGSKTEIEAGTLLAYIYVGTYTA
jgi:hypothetical protein